MHTQTSTEDAVMIRSSETIERAVARIEAALSALRQGEMILLRDDPGRENEGDLICAAQFVTPEIISAMATWGRGLICQAITAETANRLGLDAMVQENTDSHGTAFTVTVDAREGTTTGISAEDRARTVQVLADETSVPQDLRRPGHLFPLVARAGGVLERRGHTEAAVDLTRLAGLIPSGVICEVMDDDGTMARGERLEQIAADRDVLLVSLEDLVIYRDVTGDITLRSSEATRLPTASGEFTVTVWHTDDPTAREIVLLEAPVAPGGTPVVRLHSECLTGEAFHSTRCDCGPQLDAALDHISRSGGALVYLRQEGRGIGIFEKIRAYALQDQGMDTVEANIALGHKNDLRRYGAAARILRDRGYHTIQLLTNNPEKLATFQAAGLVVEKRLGLHVGKDSQNTKYRRTKEIRLGHYTEGEE